MSDLITRIDKELNDPLWEGDALVIDRKLLRDCRQELLKLGYGTVAEEIQARDFQDE
jgi:hypothetical protein